MSIFFRKSRAGVIGFGPNALVIRLAKPGVGVGPGNASHRDQTTNPHSNPRLSHVSADMNDLIAKFNVPR